MWKQFQRREGTGKGICGVSDMLAVHIPTCQQVSQQTGSCVAPLAIGLQDEHSAQENKPSFPYAFISKSWKDEQNYSGFFSLIHWYCLGSFSSASKAVSKSMAMCSIYISFSSPEVCSMLEISRAGL